MGLCFCKKEKYFQHHVKAFCISFEPIDLRSQRGARDLLAMPDVFLQIIVLIA